MIGGKLELLNKLSELTEYALRGDEFLLDEICIFLSNEFDLHSVVIFNIQDNVSHYVAGRSANAKAAYKKGSLFHCDVCKIILQNDKSVLNIDPLCKLQISDTPAFEGCFLPKLPGNSRMLLKVVRKTAFTRSDKDSLEKALQLVSTIIFTWIENHGSYSSRDNSISKIISDTTDELKTGSNAIIGYTSILAGENLTSLQLEYINGIKKIAQNILLNMNDLGELSKIELNNISRNLNKIDLTTFINEIIDIFKSRIGSRKVNFVVNVDKQLGGPVSLDDQKLRYIISSLLFVSTTLTVQGDIVLDLSVTKDNKIRFMISDSGKVLSSQTIDKIFEPFALSKIDDFKNSSITGLFLTLVSKYIVHLGGDISAASTAGKGNSFTFTISG